MNAEQGEEALRLLKYVVQKVDRYGKATLEGKGTIAAKFYMFGAVDEAKEFIETMKPIPLWRRFLNRIVAPNLETERHDGW